MSHTFVFKRRFRRIEALLIISALLITMISSVLTTSTGAVYADDVSSRSITMASSQEDSETSYTIQFTVPTGSTIGAVRVEFCDSSPIPHDTCTNFAVGDDIPQVDANAGSIATASSAAFSGASGNCGTVNLTAPSPGDRHLEFVCSAGTEAFGGTTTFTAVVDNIDNPSNANDSPTNPNNTFYARLYVYNTTTPGAMANPMSATGVIHTGGIAMSTAEQLTITARVQEVLEFCVGDTNTSAAATDDCSDISGNDIDMGVLDFASVNTASGEGENGYAMVRTNASSGVVVDYFARHGDAEDLDSNSINDGHLKVAGSTCISTASLVDQCINSVGATAETTITAGTENFGMAVTSVDQTAGSGTANLTRDANYDNLSGGYAFDGSGATDRIASSNTVVDDEALVLDWAGTASITTPTGVYSTVLTFIATATF